MDIYNEYLLMKLWWEYYKEEWENLKKSPSKYESIKFKDWLKNKENLCK